MTLRERRRTPRPIRIAESSLMGRSAVAVVVVFAAVPTAVGQLTGLAQGSRNLDQLGVPHLATTWAVTLLAAAVLMSWSYVTTAADDTRILEAVANGVIAVAAAIHLAAIVNEIGWSGSLWVNGMDAALFINCGGRAVLLLRQIIYVRGRSRRAVRKARRGTRGRA